MADQSAQEFGQVLAELRARTPESDVVLSLDTIRALTRLMGDPQSAFPAVHVTGTNGKSSTARMLERLLRAHGLRTGLFTSPDLGDPRERIEIDGEPLGSDRFVQLYRELRPLLELADAQAGPDGSGPSYFEVSVAMALAAFADAPVDIAVIEVGMGGRRDATNVVDAKVAIVTAISADHQRFLGDDLAEIALEKAGIIKAGSTAVFAEQVKEVADVLRDEAQRVGAAVRQEGLDFELLSRRGAVGGQVLGLQGTAGVYEEVFVPLYGDFQAHNAAVALVAAEALLAPGVSEMGTGTATGLDLDLVREAFADVTSPGRLEIVRRGPTVIVDAAHNLAAASALAEALDQDFDFQQLIGVVAIFADKDAEAILGALEPVLAHVVVTRTRSPRCLDPDELGEIAEDVFGEDRVSVFERLTDALDHALGLAEFGGELGGGVLATGSVTMAAEVRALLARNRRKS